MPCQALFLTRPRCFAGLVAPFKNTNPFRLRKQAQVPRSCVRGLAAVAVEMWESRVLVFCAISKRGGNRGKVLATSSALIAALPDFSTVSTARHFHSDNRCASRSRGRREAVILYYNLSYVSVMLYSMSSFMLRAPGAGGKLSAPRPPSGDEARTLGRWLMLLGREFPSRFGPSHLSGVSRPRLVPMRLFGSRS